MLRSRESRLASTLPAVTTDNNFHPEPKAVAVPLTLVPFNFVVPLRTLALA